MHMCAGAHICVDLCIHIRTCMWKPEDRLKIFLKWHLLFFLRQDLSLACSPNNRGFFLPLWFILCYVHDHRDSVESTYNEVNIRTRFQLMNWRKLEKICRVQDWVIVIGIVTRLKTRELCALLPSFYVTLSKPWNFSSTAQSKKWVSNF